MLRVSHLQKLIALATLVGTGGEVFPSRRYVPQPRSDDERYRRLIVAFTRSDRNHVYLKLDPCNHHVRVAWSKKLADPRPGIDRTSCERCFSRAQKPRIRR